MTGDFDHANILLIDDEPVTRTVTQAFLAKHGFNVTIAESAEAAFKLLSNGCHPDLLLLDVMMPGIDGFEACRMLRNQGKFAHLPIIMLTALDDQDSINRAFISGATDFVTKPINYPLLPHRLRYLLRSGSVFKSLYESQEVLINTQHIALLGNWRMDKAGDIVAASRQYLDIIGSATTPVHEKQLLNRVHREDRELLLSCRSQLASGRAYRLDYRLLKLGKTDAWAHVHERGFPYFDAKGLYNGAQGFTQDITERAAQEERIRDLAWHDRVTGLNNRDRLVELIERELGMKRENQRMAVLYIHLDSLRDISTIFGQDAADATIREQARRLREQLEGADKLRSCFDRTVVLAANYGRYDEHSFVVAIPRTKDDSCVSCFAETLHRTLSQPVILQSEDLIVKVFIGIARYPEDATDTLELTRRAMLVALHAASSDKHPVRLFDPEHDREAARRVMLERGLRLALEQGGQLQPYFQPKICAHTGKQTGAEVLLRWRHPELGMIPPVEFIPLAEESGLIHPISEWLLATVCEQIADWRAGNLNIGSISINLSTQSFFQRTLLQFIDEVLARTGVPGNQLIIELTESVLMQNADTARQVLDKLRARQIRISLDDFGTGFSSLSYLNSFPIDEIKIDRSFVIDLEQDKTTRALVQAIITLGHALGLKVVAEGVETSAQADLLRAMECDIFQGYLYARPLPAGEFATFRGPETL